MPHHKEPLFIQVWLTHFVPCFFAGAVLLLAGRGILGPGDPTSGADDPLKAALNGAAVALLTLAYHANRNRRSRCSGEASRPPYDGPRLRSAAAVGFLGGAADILLTLNGWGVLFLAVLVLSVLVWNLRAFARRAVDLLRPDSRITWNDVGELMRIYLATLIGFTLVNAALDGMHMLVGHVPPFGFSAGGDLFLNALYYTVVTMTTLGFGDIVPHTWDGKVLLIVQSLVSYFMFALMVGIITRGVTRAGGQHRD